MNALAVTLAPFVHALGWTLLHFLWQGTLVGGFYALARARCVSSAARHRLGMACLLVMLACPAATLAVLWPVPGDAAAVGAIAADSMLSASVASATPAAAAGSSSSLESLLPWCVGLWLVGVCAIALRSFLHWRRLSRIVRSATALPRDWQLRLIELGQRFGLLRPVRLLSSLEVGMPTLIGWLKPTILLPASLLTGFTPAQVELILAHELAHVRRYDYIANLVQVVVETLLFYHPAVHWICSDVRQQREQCCDDLVLSVAGGQRVAYARTLADLEEWMHDAAGKAFGTAMPALGAGGGVLLARVRRIVDPHEARYAQPARGNGMILPVLLACTGLMLAVLRMNSASIDAVGAALVRASVTSAELLAAATTFRIRTEAPIVSLPTQPAIVLPRLAPPAAREETVPPPDVQPIIKLPEAATATPRIAEPPAPVAAAPVRHEVPIEAPTLAPPSVPVADKAPAVPAAVVPAGPQLLHVVQPTYPTDALRNGMAGKVELEFRIGDDGRVRDVHVLAAQPSGVFEQSAIAALRQWRFAADSAPPGARYTRNFAFTHGSTASENCREITGSHICRRPNSESDAN